MGHNPTGDRLHNVMDYYQSVAGNTVTYTAPSVYDIQINFLHIVYTADATVGNRTVKLTYNNSVYAAVIIDLHSTVNQAASTIYHYEFLQGIYRETSVIVNTLQLPEPKDFYILAGESFTVADSANISASDSFTVAFQYKPV